MHSVQGFVLPSLGVLAGPQAQGRGAQEPQPSWKGWVLLLSISADVGERVRC